MGSFFGALRETVTCVHVLDVCVCWMCVCVCVWIGVDWTIQIPCCGLTGACVFAHVPKQSTHAEARRGTESNALHPRMYIYLPTSSHVLHSVEATSRSEEPVSTNTSIS